MRSKSYYFLLLVLGLLLLSGIFYTQKKFHYGLDVKGGLRFTYQMDVSKLTTDQRANLPEVRDKLIQIMNNRAVGPLGVTEPSIVAKGDDQIVIELPGLSNAKEAMAAIGSSARIYFYDATNVVTSKFPTRQYEPVENDQSGEPSVSFRRTNGTGGIIKWGDPEYADIIKSWTPILSGDDLAKASPEPRGVGYVPLMTFSTSGSKKMETWSRQHYDTNEQIAAVMDGKVLSIAGLQNNTILSDNAVIEGKFTPQYVTQLTDLLNAGALPVDLHILSSEQVDPTIGAQALDKIVTAGCIAFGVIALFLIAYYAFPGIVALIALMLYILFTLTVLKLINATFSLAAIAGFILSVGMAVDANILVFERFKEEFKRGKPLHASIELGFRRALPAIVDSNACTILTSLVLVNLGTGPVKGFATTLIIGVAISLFTAVTVTRSLLMFFADSGIATNPKWYALDRNWFKAFLKDESEPLRVVEKWKKWFAISAATILICIPFFFPPLSGFKLNVEFQGGTEFQYAVPNSGLTAPMIQNRLESHGFPGVNVQLGTGKGNERIAYVTVPLSSGIKVGDTAASDRVAAAAGLNSSDSRGFTSISGSIQSETIRNAVLGVIVSSVLIILFLAFRFGIGFGGFAAGMRFGVSAIGALGHDILVVFGTAAVVGFLFHWEVSALFLTAMLTMIGFSVHDTIVIFDRIRENLHRPLKNEEFGHLIDRSITQSFARSINTSMTVIVTLLILVFFGTPTPELKFFVLAMMIGIISGTYSSIYNASPILYLWDKRVLAKKGPEHTLVSMANAEVARTRIVATQRIPEQAQPQVQSPASNRSYGQVRRRANAPQQRAQIELDDDEE